MRATDLHPVALRLARLRFDDVLALGVWICGVFALPFVVVTVGISLVDWIQGNPHTVLPAILAFLDTLDGVRP